MVKVRPLCKLALRDAAGFTHRLQQTTEIRTNVSHRRSYLCLSRWGPARPVSYESTCGQLVDCIVSDDCRLVNRASGAQPMVTVAVLIGEHCDSCAAMLP